MPDLVIGQLVGRGDQRWQRHSAISWEECRVSALVRRLFRLQGVEPTTGRRHSIAPGGRAQNVAGAQNVVCARKTTDTPAPGAPPGTRLDPGCPMAPPPPTSAGKPRPRARGSGGRAVLPLVP